MGSALAGPARAPELVYRRGMPSSEDYRLRPGSPVIVYSRERHPLSMTAEWPASVRDRHVVSVDKIDRPDGYDWNAHLRFTYTNEEQMDWRMSGSLSRREEGLEWTTEFSAESLPPNIDGTKLVRLVQAKITYGDEPTGTVTSDMRPAMVDMTFTENSRSRKCSTASARPLQTCPSARDTAPRIYESELDDLRSR
jgi:hypothetical protein